MSYRGCPGAVYRETGLSGCLDVEWVELRGIADDITDVKSEDIYFAFIRRKFVVVFEEVAVFRYFAFCRHLCVCLNGEDMPTVVEKDSLQLEVVDSFCL